MKFDFFDNTSLYILDLDWDDKNGSIDNPKSNFDFGWSFNPIQQYDEDYVKY